jgi:hypothetical protein
LSTIKEETAGWLSRSHRPEFVLWNPWKWKAEKWLHRVVCWTQQCAVTLAPSPDYHTHTCTHTHMHAHTHTHTHTLTYTYIHSCTHRHTYMHTYTYMHTHIYTHAHIPIHTYTCTYIHTYIHGHAHIITHAHTYIHHMHTLHICTHIYIYIPHTFIYTHIYIYALIYPHIHIYTYIHMNTHTCTHAHIHTHTHTHTHTFWIIKHKEKCFNISFLKKSYKLQTVPFFWVKIRKYEWQWVILRSPETSPHTQLNVKGPKRVPSEKLYGRVVIFHLPFLGDLAGSVSWWPSFSRAYLKLFITTVYFSY